MRGIPGRYQIIFVPPLLLKLGHEYHDKRENECQQHGPDYDPRNNLFSDILSCSAAHFFPPLVPVSVIVVFVIFLIGRCVSLIISTVTDS